MPLRRALALALLLLASPAGAVVRNVTDDATLTIALAAAGAGDIINVAAGSYTVKPVPANSGTAGNPIRLVGSQANPGSVSFSVGLDWAGGATRSHISWTGLKLGDDVVFTRADHCSLTYCKVDSGGFYSYGANSSPASLGISENNYLGNSTFRQNVNAAFVVKLVRCHSTTFERCRFFGITTAATFEAGRGRYLYQSANNTFTDCLLSMEAWGATNGEQFTQGIRDTSKNNLFLRDSILAGLTSRRARQTLLSQSGSFPGTATPNSWVDCYFQSFHVPESDNAFEWQDGTGGVCQNSVFVCRLGRPLTLPGGAAAQSLVLRHVTAYSSDRQAFRYDPNTNPVTSRFNACAFASRVSPGSCADLGSSLFKIETSGAFASSDSNLFACADTAYAFQKSAGGITCYAPGQWRTATSNDLASRSYVLNGTVFVDTTWATLDLRPASSSSPLKSALAPGGYYGAFDVTAEGTPTPTDARGWLFGEDMLYRKDYDL